MRFLWIVLIFVLLFVTPGAARDPTKEEEEHFQRLKNAAPRFAANAKHEDGKVRVTRESASQLASELLGESVAAVDTPEKPEAPGAFGIISEKAQVFKNMFMEYLNANKEELVKHAEEGDAAATVGKSREFLKQHPGPEIPDAEPSK